MIGMTQSPEKYTFKKLIHEKYQQFLPDTLIKIIKTESSKLKKMEQEKIETCNRYNLRKMQKKKSATWKTCRTCKFSYLREEQYWTREHKKPEIEKECNIKRDAHEYNKKWNTKKCYMKNTKKKQREKKAMQKKPAWKQLDNGKFIVQPLNTDTWY